MDASNNQRVTNAVLKKDIEYLTEKVKEYRDETRESTKEFRERIGEVELNQKTLIERVDNVCSNMKKWDIGNTVGVAGAYLAAIFFGPRQ
jgi:uncharacterized coiled-coil DUF342 family protein